MILASRFCSPRALGAAAFLLASAAAFAYDIHTAALTPITEDATPAGSDVELVKDGALKFVVVNDAADAYRREIEVITNAFMRCTGQMPTVYKSSASNEYLQAENLILLGNQPFARALGVRHEELPDDGFVIRTGEIEVEVGGGGGGVQRKGVLLIVGKDSNRIANWNPTKLDQKGSSKGTLNGALDFTERFLGCRYFFPGEYGSYFPTIQNLTVTPVSYGDHPYVRWRGEQYFFYEAFDGTNRVEHYEPYLGKMPLRDTKFSVYFREGGTTPAAGMHVPQPNKWLAAHPDKKDLIFYTTPYGKQIYNASDAEQCFYDIFNLELADLLVEDWKAYFASVAASDPCGFHPYVNNEYISFGQCDYMLALKDYVTHPTVQQLGLVNAEDIARGAPMANANARFFQHLARRIETELPGKKLNILAYYTSRYASRDTQWQLPTNTTVMMCPGSMPKRARNPTEMTAVVESMNDWQAACSGTPVSHLWFYTESTPVLAAVSGEFTGEALVGLEPHFGREGLLLNTAGWKLWHYYWTFYASFRCQWNPRWDVDAGIDEHWPLFYGAEAGAHMKRFHTLLKQAFLDYFVIDSKRVYPASVIDELESELAAAGACLTEGTVEYRRWRLVADFWPDEFARHRTALAYEPPFVDMPRFRDEDGFWETVPATTNFDFALPVRFAWGTDGIHVKSDPWSSPTEIPTYRVRTTLGSGTVREYEFDSPEAVIPFAGLTGTGQAPVLYTQWEMSGGIVRFDGEEASVALPAPTPAPTQTGLESVLVTLTESLGETGVRNAISRAMQIQNDLNEYKLAVYSRRAHETTPRSTASNVGNKSDAYDKDWGFDGCGDWLKIWVNGIVSTSVPMGTNVVSYYEDGAKRGCAYPMVFDDKVVWFRFWMRPDSPALFGEVDLSALDAEDTVSARIGCLPSKLDTDSSGNGRWNGYRREYVTVNGTDELPEDAEPNESFARVLSPVEDWVFLCDADYDGSAADKSKGIGPSFIRADLSTVSEAKTRLTDHYIQGMDYKLKSGAQGFRFLIWGNHGTPTTLETMMRKFNASLASFSLESEGGGTSVPLAAKRIVTIPAGETYTLQASEAHIGASTVVKIEEGGVLDLNGLSATFAGLAGAGTVSNGTATLSLAGGPYEFDGLVQGTLVFAQGTTPDAQFGLIVGGSNTLAEAVVYEPATAVHPLRFADGVPVFNCGTLVCAEGPSLKVESVTRKPVKLVTGLVNPDDFAVKGKGSVHLAVGSGKTVTLKGDCLAGLKGQIGVTSGTLMLDSTLDLSSIGGYWVQKDATLYLRDKQTREVLAPLSSDGDGTVYFRSPMELRGTTVRLTYLYIQNDCTNIVMKDSMLTAGTVYNTKAITWNSTTNEVEISGFGGFRGAGPRSREQLYDGWFNVTGLGYTSGYFWDYGTGFGWNYRSMSNQNKLALTIRDGGVFSVYNATPAASVTVLPGGHLDVRAANAGAGRTLIDGGFLDLTIGDHYSGITLANGDGKFPVLVGPRGVTVRGYALLAPRQAMTFNNRFLSAEGTDGGVRFLGYSSTLKYPIGFNGPLYADGLVAFHNDIIGHCGEDDSPDVANDVVIANAAIVSSYAERDLQLATGAGHKVVLDGSATFRANGSQAYILGPTGAATGAAVQRNRGSALFFLWANTTQLDGSDARLLVSGGLENDDAGITRDPCFTVSKASNNGTRVDFARYDSEKGLVTFTDYVDNVDAGENAIAWISGKNVTMSSTSARVRGLVIDSTKSGSGNDTFIIPAGSTLHIGNGTDPASVIMNGNGNGVEARITGDGTLDFGSSEGVVVCHRTVSYSYPGLIYAKISGSNGLAVVSPCDLPKWSSYSGLALYNTQNDYTGGTFVNASKLEVRANGALSTGDVTVGRGFSMSGTLGIGGSCREITNALHLAGTGCTAASNYSSPTVYFCRSSTLSGPIDISYIVRFGCSSDTPAPTGTVARAMTGTGELHLWGGRYVFRGKNTYTGGSLIARNAKVALDGDDVGFGTGPVTIDPGEIDLCGTRHTFYALRGTGKILNTSAKRATLTLEHGLDLSAGEISGKIKFIVKGGAVRIGADVTLGEDIDFQLAPGTSVDWCGAARPIRQLFGGGRALNGSYTESHPKGAAIFLR